MPIKPESVLEYLGVDVTKYENDEAFKEEFDSTWVKSELAAKDPNVHKKVLGAMNGKLRSKAKKFAKALELDVEVTDDTDVSELFDTFVDVVPKKHREALSGYEEKLKNATNDKAAKEWEGKYGELQKKYTDLEKLHGEGSKKYAELENSIKEKEFTSKVDGYWNDALGKVKFKPGLDELTKDGFVSKMKSQYRVLADDEGKLYTADKEGNRIADKRKAQTFRELGDLLSDHAKEFKLDASNPHANAPVNRGLNGQVPPKQPDANPVQPVRQVHPGRMFAGR